MNTVAFIGLGNMGSPMVLRLIEAGYEVHASDLSGMAVSKAVEHGAVGHQSASDAASERDIVILMLPNTAIVRSVIDGLLSSHALKRGATVIDMSSSEPLATRALAQRLAESGVSLIDAPVSGGVAGAERGTLTVMTGGPGDLVDHARPLLEQFGSVIHVGDVGAGHAVKALNNLLSATHLLSASEVITIGRRFGLDTTVMLDVFNISSGRSGSTETKWPQYIVNDAYNSGFSLGLMVKDLRTALGLAEATDSEHELSEQVLALWEQARTMLPESADHTEIAKWVTDPGDSPGTPV